MVAIGLLTKVNFVGLVPGVLAGLIVLSIRAARVSGRSAYRSLAVALGVAFSPIALYAAINALSDRPVLGAVSSAIGSSHGSLPAQLNYIWQLYLPRLPGTVDDFPGLFTAKQLWFNGYVGLYGWLDTPFPGWIDDLALIPAAAIAVLFARSLLAARSALRGRAAEIAVYAAIAIGLLVLIGADSFQAFPRPTPNTPRRATCCRCWRCWVQSRAGCAWRRPSLGTGHGVAIVVLFLAHDVFSQLQVVARFYG